MTNASTSCRLILLLFVCSTVALSQTVNSDDQDANGVASSTVYARALASREPAVRQEAAEALARLAAVAQRKLVEGYHVQETDKKVRLALDWALYRMGKSDSLYRIVRELDSSRHDQAVGYLSKLESPALLYPFLKEKDVPAKIVAGVIEALGQLGDSQSLEVINPYRESFAPGVSSAAEAATDLIEKRLAAVEPAQPSRPRTVNTTQKDPP